MQYRAKRKSDRSWTEGALIPYGNEPKIIHAISVYPEFTDSENVYYCEGSPVDPDTVCRFTGMYDNPDLWASLNHDLEECWRKANHEA